MSNLEDKEITLTSDVFNNFCSVTKKAEKFLSPQLKEAEKLRILLKQLYDLTKVKENKIVKNTLPELITEGFDDEQIWQQIELQNNSKCNEFVSNIAHIIAKKNVLSFNHESCELRLQRSKEDDIMNSTEESIDDSNDDDDDDDDDEEDVDKSENKKVSYKSSAVDDQFFNLDEMEKYIDKIEKGEVQNGESDDEFVDYFKSSSEDENDDEEDNVEESNRIFYSSFFDAPRNNELNESKRKIIEENDSPRKKIKQNDEVIPRKKVHFAENNDVSSEDENLSSDEDVEGDKKSNNDDNVKSSFELRQERLKARIESLENEALKEKSWQLTGETSATARPENSLLEEYVEFDLTSRPAPIITEATTFKLEDIIKQRIKDKAWDDVERKIKPIEDPHEYKKKLVLDQEKSKFSLAEIYEQEFVKQRDNNVSKDELVEKPEEVNVQHIEVTTLMKKLFYKLDALSNFHYTPKQAAPEIKIISNMPGVNMEEVAPVATSDAALLAPEEIKSKSKGDDISKNERTRTDKKRERRRKKIKQREREKAKEKKEKLLNKLKPGMGNKYTKEKASRLLDNVMKNDNVTQLVDKTDGKVMKTSKTFFSHLQDEVKNQIKTKTKAAANKPKTKFNAKKIKM